MKSPKNMQSGWQRGLVLGLIVVLIEMVLLYFLLFTKGYENLVPILIAVALSGLGYALSIPAALLFHTAPQQVFLYTLFLASILQYAIFGWILWDRKKRFTALLYLFSTVVIGFLPFVIGLLFYCC